MANIVKEFIIPAREARAFLVSRGQILRIIEVEGKQVGDAIFFNAHNHREYFDASDSLLLNIVQRIGTIRKLGRLYSKPPYQNVMFMVVEDPVGIHFCLTGTRCTKLLYEARDGIKDHANCQDNLAAAIRPFGLGPDDVHDVFNIFMNADLDEHGYTVKAPTANKGDYIDLQAEMDCLVAISACPADVKPTNDYVPKPLGIQIREIT